MSHRGSLSSRDKGSPSFDDLLQFREGGRKKAVCSGAKLSIVCLVQEGKHTVVQIERVFGIRGNRIHKWKRVFAENPMNVSLLQSFLKDTTMKFQFTDHHRSLFGKKPEPKSSRLG